jgi:hypothetical protein
LAVGLPLAGLGAGLMLVVVGLVAWGVHRRWVKAVGDEAKNHEEGVKP